MSMCFYFWRVYFALGSFWWISGTSYGWSFLPKLNSQTSPKLPPSNVKLLILPGFGNDGDDYFLKEAVEGSLVESLKLRGWALDEESGQSQIRVLPISRSDWFKVFTRGVWDSNFWAGNASATGPAFGWYLDLISTEIRDLCKSEEDRVVLLGHSAGGWLARAALGYCSTTENDVTEIEAAFSLGKVLGLVTLGTPHLPPPANVMDMTRGALRLTQENFPHAYHSPDIFYITVMGQSVVGKPKAGTKRPWERRSQDEFAFDSYELVCGEGATIGDGVVPLCSGHLDRAQQIDLPGVLHSINAPSRWYGSTGVLDEWHSSMMDEIYKAIENDALPERPVWISRIFP